MPFQGVAEACHGVKFTVVYLAQLSLEDLRSADAEGGTTKRLSLLSTIDATTNHFLQVFSAAGAQGLADRVRLAFRAAKEAGPLAPLGRWATPSSHVSTKQCLEVLKTATNAAIRADAKQLLLLEKGHGLSKLNLVVADLEMNSFQSYAKVAHFKIRLLLLLQERHEMSMTHMGDDMMIHKTLGNNNGPLLKSIIKFVF